MSDFVFVENLDDVSFAQHNIETAFDLVSGVEIVFDVVFGIVIAAILCLLLRLYLLCQ